MDPFPRPGQGVGRLHAARALTTCTPICCSTSATNMTASATYAHEWGHAMHTLLANAAQPYELSGYPTFTAEVASTTHELLLANMMVERAKTKQEKLFYLGQIMENYRGTFFRQAMFARVPAGDQRPGRQGRGAVGREDVGALSRHPQALPRPEGDDRAGLWRRMGVHPALLLRLLRLAICDLDHRRELLRAEGDARRRRPTATAISTCFAPAGRTMATTSSRRAGSIWRRRSPTG